MPFVMHRLASWLMIKCRVSNKSCFCSVSGNCCRVALALFLFLTGAVSSVELLCAAMGWRHSFQTYASTVRRQTPRSYTISLAAASTAAALVHVRAALATDCRWGADRVVALLPHAETVFKGSFSIWVSNYCNKRISFSYQCSQTVPAAVRWQCECTADVRSRSML